MRKKIMLLLSLALVAGCEKTPQAPAADREDRPSFTFEGFQAFGTRGEENQWRAWAEKAEVFNDRKLALAQQLKVHYFNGGKVVSILTADLGKINTATQDVTATGKVVLQGENGVVLKTDLLLWDHSAQRIHTPARVRVERKDTIMTGTGLVSDRNLGSVEVLKDVKIRARSVKALREMGEELGE